MHFALFYILFVLATLVQSAPTAPLDAATLLKNAQDAQKLNAQFQSVNSTATGSCNNGDTTCVNDAIATCVNGQFDTSKGTCPASQHCFALPSVKSSGTIITCTSEKNAQSLINASGATGNVTVPVGSGASTPSINPASMNSTRSASTVTTTTIYTPPATTTDSVVTVIITLTPSIPMTLPSVTTTLSPDQASSVVASLLAQSGPTTTANPSCLGPPS